MKLHKLSANATELKYPNGALALYSYETLVAVWTPGGVPYCQRDGKAGSRTTAKHITQWANRNSLIKPQVLPESDLLDMLPKED